MAATVLDFKIGGFRGRPSGPVGHPIQSVKFCIILSEFSVFSVLCLFPNFLDLPLSSLRVVLIILLSSSHR